MAAPALERRPVFAERKEHGALESVEGLLKTTQRPPRLVGPDGEEIEIPPSLFDVLRVAVHTLLKGDAVSIAHVGAELTTTQAAEMLNVSRPYLTKLLERDEIPYHMVGTHRRIRLGDLLEYRDKRYERREQALTKLAQISQELGLYDK